MNRSIFKNILDEVIKSKNKIVGVIGKKSKFNSDYYDLVKYSKKRMMLLILMTLIQIKFYDGQKKNPISPCIDESIVEKRFLKIAPRGTIGYHPSDLPKIEEGIQLYGA